MFSCFIVVIFLLSVVTFHLSPSLTFQTFCCHFSSLPAIALLKCMPLSSLPLFFSLPCPNSSFSLNIICLSSPSLPLHFYSCIQAPHIGNVCVEPADSRGEESEQRDLGPLHTYSIYSFMYVSCDTGTVFTVWYIAMCTFTRAMHGMARVCRVLQRCESIVLSMFHFHHYYL